MYALSEKPRYQVVSVRVTDDEREALQLLSRRTLKSVSDIVREAIALGLPHMPCLCTEQDPTPGQVAAGRNTVFSKLGQKVVIKYRNVERRL